MSQRSPQAAALGASTQGRVRVLPIRFHCRMASICSCAKSGWGPIQKNGSSRAYTVISGHALAMVRLRSVSAHSVLLGA